MGEMADWFFERRDWDYFDPDWDEELSSCSSNSTKWHCKDGTVIKDMTDLHLANAIAYSERRHNFSAVDLLIEEWLRRSNVNFMEVKMECPFCQDTMTRKEYVSDPEDCTGWGGWMKYAFTCNKCGARGPLHDKHEYKTIQCGTTKRTPTSVQRNKVVLRGRTKARSIF